MSNYCKNYIKIIGNAQQIEEFRQRYLYKQGTHPNIEEDFSFISVSPIPTFEDDLQGIQRSNWCLQNWGTKYDAKHVSVIISNELGLLKIRIYLQTTLLPPLGIIHTLSNQNPHLHFKILYRGDAMNFAGFQYYHDRVQFDDQFVQYFDDEDDSNDSDDNINQFTVDFTDDLDIHRMDYDQQQAVAQVQIQQLVRQKNLTVVNTKNYIKYNRKTLIRFLSKHKVRVNVYKGKKLLLEEVLRIANNYKLKQLQCPICYQNPKNPIKIQCNHIFCFECISKWKGDKLTHTCPLCRRPF